jgi:nitroreductase
MINDLIKNRYSARTWTNQEIDDYKTNYIVEAACNAPSKQSLYPWKLYILGDSEESKKFKEWLFWEDTWCVNGERANPKDRKSPEKRFNGQYRAPLLLLWAHRDLDPEKHKDENYWNYYRAYTQEQNLIDMTVSASFAMLAAEEQGLRTSFGRCHSWEFEHKIFDGGKAIIGIALGIGYAEEHKDYDTMIYPVTKNKRLEGYETKNLSQNFPLKKHNIRKNKPDIKQITHAVK